MPVMTTTTFDSVKSADEVTQEQSVKTDQQSSGGVRGRLLGGLAKKVTKQDDTVQARATFITTALENGAHLEDVQKAAGHCDPSTTKLYDRRGYNPNKAASFFATYNDEG